MPISYLKKCRQQIVNRFTITDFLFLSLRIATILGSFFWLLFAPLSAQDATSHYIALALFSLYSLLIYIFIFFQTKHIRKIYILSLLLDLSYIFYLVHLENRFENSFFLGYYLLVVLHTLYFGRIFGLLVATMSAALYLHNTSPFWDTIHWTEPGIRIIFLYLIGMPAGLIYSKLKDDKDKIEDLNSTLSDTLDNLRSAQVKLVESEKLSALGRLTECVAHEIRNPLTALGGFSRRLAKNMSVESTDKRYIDNIIHEVERLEAILRDILLFGRGGKELQRDTINPVIKQGVSFFLGLYKGEKLIKLNHQYDENLPRIYLDSEQVKQVMGNLISNAIDSIEEEGEITICTSTEHLNDIDWVTVSVTDNGQGFTEKEESYIFEPFYSTKRTDSATGLGLTIVHEIMEEHRGFIRAKSSKDTGSTFTLYFPSQPESEDNKTACWDCLGCGIKTDPAKRCPAYPYFGRTCWAIAGTMCEGKTMGTYAEKISDCRDCPFYQRCNTPDNHQGEAPACPAYRHKTHEVETK